MFRGRRELLEHGLDPELADVAERQRAAAQREQYELRHGRG
ncbi:hypothetical protein [Nocardia sp. BSTN01]|nr:hypothetical protein [Nocardia sp. BSTN01]